MNNDTNQTTETIFMHNQKLGIFSNFLKKKNSHVAILGKPLYEVKIFAEPHQWWNFVQKILFQKCLKKKIVLGPKLLQFWKAITPWFLSI